MWKEKKRKKTPFALVHFNSQGNFPHGGFMEMGCSSCRPWPEHYRKCIFMEDLLQLPTGEGRGTGVCSVNGQLRAVMWIPSVKLNWFALSTSSCSMLKAIVTDTPFPSVRTPECAGLARHFLLGWDDQQAQPGVRLGDSSSASSRNTSTESLVRTGTNRSWLCSLSPYRW